jgi:hypothetical protein
VIGAGDYIGAAIAKRFAAEGFTVLAGRRHGEKPPKSGPGCARRGQFAQHVEHPRAVEGSIEAPLTVLAELQRQGLVRHIGLSNVTPSQVEEARRFVPIVCVQNLYNVAHRTDDALIDALVRTSIACVPFFPLGGFTPLQSSILSDVAKRLGGTPMQVVLAWLHERLLDVGSLDRAGLLGRSAQRPCRRQLPGSPSFSGRRPGRDFGVC